MKKTKKFLSVLLALVMVLSVAVTAVSAAAADAQKPEYTELVAEKDFEQLFTDVNTILSRDVLNGNTVQEIYKFLPSLSSIVNNGSTKKSTANVQFYKDADAERFAELDKFAAEDGTIINDEVDENGAIVTEGTFTRFFKENPIVCDDLAAFQTEVNKIIDMVVIENVTNTIIFAFAMGGDLESPKVLGNGLDEVCKALGVAQEKTANEVFGFETFSADVAGVRTYLKNIVAALLPDTANALMSIIRSVAADENGAALYSGVNKILGSLDKVLTVLAPQLEGLGVDLTSVQATLTKIKTTFEALPTTGEGELVRLDIEGVISYAVTQLAGDSIALVFGNATSDALIVIGFKSMDLDRLAGAQSTADVMKMIYDYLYNNLVADQRNNKMVKAAVTSIEGIPEEIRDFVVDALKLKNDELAYDLMVLVAKEAGREMPERPTEEPTEPSEPSTEAPTDKPTEPSTDEPAEPENPVPAGDAAIAGISALALAAAAAFVLTKKKH